MKKALKILERIVETLLVILVLLLGATLLPIPGNYKILTVRSGSMEPAIRTGSIVVMKSARGPAAEYKVGDIITFGENTKTIAPTTHRIFEITETAGAKTYITKGDANNAPDQKPLAENEILGQALFSVPYAGYAVYAAKQPYGFVLIVVLPALLIIFDEIKNIRQELLRMRKEKDIQPVK
jgi:signal peptidase I